MTPCRSPAEWAELERLASERGLLRGFEVLVAEAWKAEAPATQRRLKHLDRQIDKSGGSERVIRDRVRPKANRPNAAT